MKKVHKNVIAIAVITLAGVLLVLCLLLAKRQHEEGVMRNKYDSVALGASLQDAEAAIELRSGYYILGNGEEMEVIEGEYLCEARLRSYIRYYESGRFGMMLWCDPHTKRVMGKELVTVKRSARFW